MSTIAFVKETPEAWIYEGLAIPYGGPMGGQDLTGSHFTKDSDLCLDWFPDGGRPVLYRHGFDPEVKAAPVGRETGAVREDDRGRWYQFQIEKAKAYATEVKQLADEGVLALSSGAVDHLVAIAAKSGEITRWPWVELSLVPNPASPEALFYQVKSIDAVDHLTIVGTPEPEAMKDSEAAYDAQEATWSMTTLLGLLGDESDEAQAAKLRVAIEAIQSFITAEVAEIGTPEDVQETLEERASWLSTDPAVRSKADTIQGIHDAAASLGADCAMGKSAPAAPRLVITGTPAAKAEDLTALTEAMKAVATERARSLLGR